MVYNFLITCPLYFDVRKKLRVDVARHFPQLQEEDVSNLIPLKEDVSCMRLFTHKGEAVKAYMVSV